MSRGLGLPFVLVLLLGPGCSLLNRPAPFVPDDAPDDVLDAGVDARLDTPIGEDGGRPLPEAMCDDGADDDMDGAADCADADCAGAPACCRPGAAGDLLDERWCDLGLGPSWVPGGLLPMGAGMGCTEGRLGAPSLMAASVINRNCVPLAAGASISTTLIGVSTDCEGCEAMLALTPVPAAGAGGILDDVAVRLVSVGAQAHLELTQAGRVLGRLPDSGGLPGGDVSFTLRLFPSTNQLGAASIGAIVDATWATGSGRVGPLSVVDFTHLRGPTAGCTTAPGLFVGLQIEGRGARFGPLTVTSEECPNPNFFRAAGALPGRPAPAFWLDAARLGFDEVNPEHAWTRGGVGSGSVTAVRNAGRVSWHYFVDGTNLNRANDEDRDLDFSIGGVLGEDPGLGAPPFLLRGGEMGGGAPLAGHDAPTCTGGMTMGCGQDDYRDPAVFISRGFDGMATGTTGEVVWAARNDMDGTTALVHAAVSISDTRDVLGPPTPVFAAAIADCPSPSHPAILTPHPGGSEGHFLVFVCGEGRLASVYGARVDSAFMPMEEATMLFAGPALGFELGIVDVDGAVFGRRGTAAGTYRLWVAGADRSGITRLALTEAPVVPPTGRDRVFVAFSGNPVLSSTDDLFADGPDRCMGTCEITGVGVAREPGPEGTATDWGQTVRVVVSVTDQATGGVRHAIVPLEQTMP